MKIRLSIPPARHGRRAGLVAAGCAVGPDYQKPQSAPVTLASPEQALFSNGQLQRDWWKQLQDPQLDRLIGLALERNHDIRIAQAGWPSRARAG